MSVRIFNRGLLMALVLGLGCACEDKPAPRDAGPAAVAKDVASQAPAGPVAPWFVGSWKGSALLKAGPGTLEVDRSERGGDERPAATGTEQRLDLTVEISDLGDVSGEAQWGKHTLGLGGVLDGSTLRLQLSGHGVQATLVAGRAREAEPKSIFEGTVTASLTETAAGQVSAQTFVGPIEIGIAP